MRFVLAAALLVIVLCAGIWDIYVTAKGQPLETVSVVLHQWSLMYPVLPLLVGVIIGHIFWPNVGVTIIAPKGL